MIAHLAAMAAAAVLALANTGVTENEVIALINAGAAGQGEKYDVLSIKLVSAVATDDSRESWICGSFTGNLVDGTPVEERIFMVNRAEMSFVLEPAESLKGSDAYLEQQDRYFAAYQELC